jgi:hypothetical protein
VTAALAIPVTLALGVLGELAGGLARRLGRGERGWWRGVTGRWEDLRRLLRSGRARPAVVEAGGAAAALAGAGLAGAAALGLVPGSMALAYPALAMGAVGAHLATPVRAGGETPAAIARRAAALAEAAFVVALGAMVLRWRSVDLDAIRGTQSVLGPGISLGPALVGIGLGLGAAVALLAGALRLPPPPSWVRRGRQARGAGASFLSALATWSVAGASALVVAVLVAGHRLDLAPSAVPFAGAAVAASMLIGAVGALLRRLRPRAHLVVSLGAVVVAGGAAVLVLLG